MAQGDRDPARQGIEWVMEVSRSMQLQWPRAGACILGARLKLDESDPGGAEDLARQALRIFHRAGSAAGEIECLELLGEIAARFEGWADATRLISAARSLREQTGTMVPAPDAAIGDALVAELRVKLGTRFDQEWQEGTALDRDGVVDLATDGGGRGFASAPGG
ncbi:MAG: hypothetical protein ABR575_02470 [Actinomycetota bacterium]